MVNRHVTETLSVCEGSVYFFSRDRKVLDTHTDSIGHSVGNGRGYRPNRVLPNALGVVGSRAALRCQDERVQCRDILHIGNLVVAKADAGHPAFVHYEFLAQRVTHALHDSTLDLALVVHWVQDSAHIMRRSNAQELHRT